MKLSVKRFVPSRGALLTAATISGVAALYTLGVPILDYIELRTYDLRFQSRGAVSPSDAVVLVMVDEKSLDVVGRWPWPRSKMAEVVDRLSEAGAKVIAFDVGFLEANDSGASDVALLEQVARALEGAGVESAEIDALAAETRRRADDDGALARAIERSPAAVVLGYFFHMSEDALEYSVAAAEMQRQLALIASSKYPLVSFRGGMEGAAMVPAAYAPEGNVESLARVAESSGYFTVRQDADGVVRWMPLVIGAGEEMFPPLSVLAAWHWLDRPPLAASIGPRGVEAVALGDRSVPTDPSGRLLINYRGGPKTFRHVSVADVLGGAFEPGAFTGRVALIGAAATGIYDTRATPFNPVHPGAEIHATVIDNLVTGDVMTRPPWVSLYDLLAIVVLTAATALVLPRLNAVADLVFAGGLGVAHVAVARELFAARGVWINVVYPLLALGIAYTTHTLGQFLAEQRERRKIRSAFGHYVAPVVIEQMLDDPDRLKLGGQEKVLTVLFSDLQGFTSYSERYTPQQMIELLSEYYARMTERVFEHEGMLKEYVGDELMAIFGAPVEHADHARRACAAALAMRDHRHAMTREWLEVGRPPLNARTGVNSGRMLVGNLGSEYRFAYGVLGDNVNLGSRLEGMNKEYGTEILIGEGTAELLDGEFVLREVDQVRVVGKKKPTRIYELIAARGDVLDAEHEAALKSYAEALAAYRAQRWKDALGFFDETLRRRDGDGPTLTMVRRCRLYLETPPAEDWDGVFEATKK